MSDERIIKSYNTWFKPFVFFVVILIHCALLYFVNFKEEETFKEEDYKETKIFKLVDVQEFVPPPPEPKIIEQKVEVKEQPKASEKIEVTEEKVEEEPKKEEIDPDAEYIPQQKISKVPVFPVKNILSKLEYPKMAKKQGIEGVVLLELFIDKNGKIQKIKVLKDPGNGFAEAAVSAFTGINCVPALINGTPCAVRYRYPVRFKLN